MIPFIKCPFCNFFMRGDKVVAMKSKEGTSFLSHYTHLLENDCTIQTISVWEKEKKESEFD